MIYQVFGPTKEDTVADLAFLVGAKVINEQLGDDLDLIDVDCLGEAYTAITDDKNNCINNWTSKRTVRREN